jgi:hypothetical protein
MTVSKGRGMGNRNRSIANRVHAMLVENTGRALCDSGDAYGRAWQRNQGQAVADFQKRPQVTWDGEDWTVDIFHFLTNRLYLDDVCDSYNRRFVPAKDWDGEYYGVSHAANEWLGVRGFRVHSEWKSPFNSYNWSSKLSQDIQGTFLELNGTEYVLIQVHGGCDIRGGYTDARLFTCDPSELYTDDVWGTVTRPDGTSVEVSSSYDRYQLTDDSGQPVTITDADKVELECWV